MKRAFRFGLQLPPHDVAGAVTAAQRAEAAGFDVVHTCDHLGPGIAPPFTPLAAIATATDRIRLCPLVGVNGRRALAHAVRHADTVGLTMLGRTLADSQRHETRWEADRLDATVAHIRAEAHAAGRDPELHALVQAVVLTDDRGAAAADAVARGTVPTVADACS